MKVMTSVLAWTVMVAGLASSNLGLCQETSGVLYLLSGKPHDSHSDPVPTHLYRVEEGGTLSRLVAGETVSADSILVDYDHEILTITHPESLPQNLKIIHFGSTLTISDESLGIDEMDLVLATHYFRTQGIEGLAVGLLLERDGSKDIRAFSTGQDHPRTFSLSKEGCEDVQVEGSTGTDPTWSDRIIISSLGNYVNSLPPSITDRAPCKLGFSFPPTMKEGKDSNIYLQVNTTRHAVISSTDEMYSSSDGVGSRLNHIYDKASNNWREISVPGYASMPRSFGEWLVYTVRGPKNKKGMVVSGNQPAQLPGILFIYNSSTLESYTINTGFQDTEALLVSGNTLHFRVNDSLYRVILKNDHKMDLSMATFICTNPALNQVHWAFQSQK